VHAIAVHDAAKMMMYTPYADAVLGDLLTQPHQEHGAGHQRQDDGRGFQGV
jgi:hypothetical protein